LKLAYSQFEELESFARFGTRLDESTRQIIEHGRRIRECLKQAESQPLSVKEQILVLLALEGRLFDRVPLDAMLSAEQALRDAIDKCPADVLGRFMTDKLSDADRQAALEMAEKTLAAFHPAAESTRAESP
jgi:F-type H+-transporting ATPase subunit alpha